MTTKKIIVVVVSVLVALGLIIAIFVGGVVGIAFYEMANSDAARVSREFLQKNEKLKQDIGAVKSFGKLVTGSINLGNGDGTAELNLKVVGERKTVNASVTLILDHGNQWQVTAASYKDEGKTVDLFNPYEARSLAERVAA
jgi:ribosomal protein L10